MSSSPLDKGRFSAPVTQDVVASDWQKRGYGCHLFVDQPGQEWRGFVHDTNELVTVIDGLLEVSVNGQMALLSPGDEFFIPRNGVHDVINRSTGVTRWLFGYD